LKYCPYGPLVEQSPLLPVERSEAAAHNEYLKKCLASGRLGDITPLTTERREMLERWLGDESILTAQAWHTICNEQLEARIAASPDPLGELERRFSSELPPIEEYRVSYDWNRDVDFERLSPADRKTLNIKIRERKAEIRRILRNGIDDSQSPLDVARRALFEKEVSGFDENEFPEQIPKVISDGSCNIFGHICPVFFAAEAMTETTTERRRGRYIQFSTKMRVVRRDNHTCQHCGKHLRDDEVEFDHKIPISRGGSSEEHNIRLTCFDCNRDKTDKIDI
jgi:hypothetical protein